MSRAKFRIPVAAGLLLLAVLAVLPADMIQMDKLTDSQARALRVKNVILMIGDGMGAAQSTLGRWYKYARTGVNRLAFDHLATGLVRTYWATGWLTDSAPAASAMATGVKTSAGNVSLYAAKVEMPDVPPLRAGTASTPAATVLEAARGLGLATGLVVTSEISHATPAAFISHYVQRGNQELLMEQAVHQNADVLLGGGRKYLDASLRKDKEDLVRTIVGRGYTYVTDREGLLAAPPGRIWGAFAMGGLDRDMDRDPRVTPSLEEMTVKALAVLSRQRKGFFLMVEGSQIDWAAHANDPVSTGSEVLSFDKAVQVALDFAARDGHTAVIVTADHTTGGLSIGGPDSSDQPISRLAKTMERAKVSTTKASKTLTGDDSPPPEKALGLLTEWLGISDWSEAEISGLNGLLKERSSRKLEVHISKAVSRRVGVGWAHTGHSGEDVPLYVWHPKGPRLGGVVQNTDIARYISACLGFSLPAWTTRLFAGARDMEAAGARLSVDASDPQNPVLEAVREGIKLRLPVNKSAAELDGRPVDLGGVIVCTGAIGGQTASDPKLWFYPRKAVELLTRRTGS